MSFVFICATVHVNLCDTFGCKLLKTQFLRSCCVTPLFYLRLRADKNRPQFAVAYCFRNVRQARQIFTDKTCSVVLLQRNFVVVFVRDIKRSNFVEKRRYRLRATTNACKKRFLQLIRFLNFAVAFVRDIQKVKLCRKGAISATGVVKGLQKVFPTIDTV